MFMERFSQDLIRYILAVIHLRIIRLSDSKTKTSAVLSVDLFSNRRISCFPVVPLCLRTLLASVFAVSAGRRRIFSLKRGKVKSNIVKIILPRRTPQFVLLDKHVWMIQTVSIKWAEIVTNIRETCL